MKGQNLRIIINGKVVAAARDLTFEQTAQVESVSTKDTPDGWDEYECVGKSWNADVNALVIDGWNPTKNLPTSGWSSPATIDGETYFYGSTGFSITIPAGKSLTVEGFTRENHGWAILNSSGTTVYAENTTGTGSLVYANEGTTGKAVKVAWRHDEPTEGSWVRFGITNEANQVEGLIEYLEAGNTVICRFSTMTGTDHRTEDECLRQGNAQITNISVSSSNKALVTYSCKLEGVGELAEPE